METSHGIHNRTQAAGLAGRAQESAAAFLLRALFRRSDGSHAGERIEYTIFLLQPEYPSGKEYLLRKEENIRFAEKHNVPFIDADYDTDNWFERAKGMENEPERGIRCTMCFDMRFERTALYAHEHGFPVISSSLGISRWKDMNQINDCGVRAAAKYPDMLYWEYNWRKKGGSARMIEISKRENFYQQEYCGCVYSLRDTNKHRRESGRERIAMGVQFYGKNHETLVPEDESK